MFQRRLIVLGASNVVNRLHLVLQSACHAWGSPLDVMAAIGHGRSFGVSTTVMGRMLPGILECGLWEEWRDRSSLPTAALVTDIGNDILFGSPPERIAGWVRQCLERLAPYCERMVITELPLDSLATLGPRRFRFMRRILFPRSQIQWPQGLDLAADLNRRVVELASEFGAVVVRPQSTWYGFDPIHIRGRRSPAAWRHILSSLEEPELDAQRNGSARPVQLSWLAAIQAWRWRPKYRTVLGVEQTQKQPAGFLPDGTAVSLY